MATSSLMNGGNTYYDTYEMDTYMYMCGTCITVEPLYCGHLGDLVECPVYSGTPLLGPGGVSRIERCPYFRGYVYSIFGAC